MFPKIVTDYLVAPIPQLNVVAELSGKALPKLAQICLSAYERDDVACMGPSFFTIMLRMGCASYIPITLIEGNKLQHV